MTVPPNPNTPVQALSFGDEAGGPPVRRGRVVFPRRQGGRGRAGPQAGVSKLPRRTPPTTTSGAHGLHEKESYSFKFEKRYRAARIDSPKKGRRFLAKTGVGGGGWV